MSLHLMIGLIGLLYILMFGGMALLRREGLSTRFAIEALCITAIAVVLVVLTPIQIHPVLFLLLLYLITLRVRLLVDLANSFARRGRFEQAEKIYNFASQLWPDLTSQLIVSVNQAILLLQENKIEESITLFTEVLNQSNQSSLGVKYEAAAHFNLGVAYLRQNEKSKATIEFNSTIDTWPASPYAQRAHQALERQHNKASDPAEEKPADQ
jgi:tetratricopeptide (TPR) repeat protein